MQPFRLTVILASTRPGRVGAPVADWTVERASARTDLDVRLVDLAELALPFLDEPNHPRLRQYTHAHTRSWSATVEASDGFVFVMPEYNHGFTAPLKNALDFLFDEWAHKPVGIVSYGGVSGGTRAVQLLKPVLSGLKLIPVTEAVYIPFVRQFLDADGRFVANDELELAMGVMLDEVTTLTKTMTGLRAAI
jgi:NAD(P)H-dependent FMN reductase